MKAPDICPMCGESNGWKLIDTSKKGFNAKNAIIGGVLLGGVGLVAGFSGKKKSTYQCVKCGFCHEYDGLPADKDRYVHLPFDGYKNSGLNSVYIDFMRRVTPDCRFCGRPQELYVKQDGTAYRFLCSHCHSVFRCEFTFGGKVKGKSVQILDCGEVNENNFSIGSCDPRLLILNESKIK